MRPMTELRCEQCGSASFVRNGMAQGHQRYRCKACGRSFTATPARGKPPAMKALAVLLCALGNVSQGMIAKLLGVSHVAVYKRIRAAGEEAPAPSATPADNIVQIDEMWRFVDGKKQGLGPASRRPCGTASPGLGIGWA
jgi:transposase-like protein